MSSEHRLTAFLCTLLCIFLCYASVQARGCTVSDNEVKKLNEQNAVKLQQQMVQMKADCVNAGGSYDDRGACYRGVH